MMKLIFTIIPCILMVLPLDGQPGRPFIDAQDFGQNLTSFGISSVDECNQGIEHAADLFGEFMYGSDMLRDPAGILNEVRDSTLYYGWDASTSGWYLREKEVYLYNSFQQNTEVIRHQLNYYTGAWIPVYKTVYHFDAHGNISGRDRLNLDNETGIWTFSVKFNYVYDDHSNIIQSTEYQWDISSGKWVPKRKNEYTFSDDQILELHVNSVWNTGQNAWVNNKKTETVYYADPDRSEETQSDWDIDMNEWVLSSSVIYSYDDSGKVIEHVYGTWQPDTEGWFFFKRVLLEYDERGNLNLLTEYQWHGMSEEWAFPVFTRFLLTYDDHDRLISYSSNIKTYGSEFWVPQYLYNLAWDATGFYVGYESYRWSEDMDLWIGLNKFVHYYSPFNVSAKETSFAPAELIIFPNPTVDLLFIRGSSEEKLSVTDTRGNVLFLKTSGNMIDLSLLLPGVYFLRVESGNRSIIKKIVKK